MVRWAGEHPLPLSKKKWGKKEKREKGGKGKRKGEKREKKDEEEEEKRKLCIPTCIQAIIGRKQENFEKERVKLNRKGHQRPLFQGPKSWS